MTFWEHILPTFKCSNTFETNLDPTQHMGTQVRIFKVNRKYIKWQYRCVQCPPPFPLSAFVSEYQHIVAPPPLAANHIIWWTTLHSVHCRNIRMIPNNKNLIVNIKKWEKELIVTCSIYFWYYFSHCLIQSGSFIIIKVNQASHTAFFINHFCLYQDQINDPEISLKELLWITSWQ